MKLESINLTNWKIFREPVNLEFSPGLNVLYGPNESGKSTLLEAIRTVFYNKHTSKSQMIKSIIPWGSNLSPKAQIIFQENGDTYRIIKSFISPESILEKYFDDQWNRIQEGDKADKEVVRILGGQLPPRGDSKPVYWGLGQSLWMIQGDPFISEELNPETISSLKGLIGAAIESEEEKKVLNNIEKQFSSVYTKTRKLTSKSELSKLNNELDEIREELQIANSQKVEKDRIIRDIEDKEYFLQKEEKELEKAKDEKQNLTVEVENARKHREERLELKNKVENLNLEYDNLKSNIDSIHDSKSTIEELNKKKEELQLQITPLEENFASNKEVLEGLKTQINTLEAEIEDLSEKKRVAGIAHTTIMEEQELQQKISKFNYVQEISQKIKNITEEINSLKSPTLDELESIETLAREIRDTETRLEAIGLSIESDIQEGSGDLFLDGEETSSKLEKGKKSWKAHQSFILDLNDIGTITVKSGSQDVKKMKEDLINLKNEYQENTSPYQTDNPQDLRGLYDKKRNLENKLSDLEEDLYKHAEKGIEELDKEIIKLKKKIEINWEQIPPEKRLKEYKTNELPAIRENLSNEIIELEKQIDDLKERKERAVENQNEELSAKEDLQSKLSKLNGEIIGNNERLEQVKKQLNKEETDGLTLEKKEDKLDQISQELNKKERALNAYNNEIKEKEETPLSKNDSIESKVENLQDSINNHRIRYSNLNKDLEYIINNSKDSNKLEEKLVSLEKVQKQLETEAKAFELLYDLNTHYKKSTLEALSEPVNRIFSKDLEKLLGSSYVFDLGDGVKPEMVDVVGANEQATIDCLSFGTQEQIWCLFRLALGQLLSQKEPQLVILDDPLVNTDEARLNRAMEILEDTAENVQLIVVTCDMEKYSSLNAKFIGLERGSLI